MGFASGVVANPATIPPAYSAFTVIPSRVAFCTIGGTITPKVMNYEINLKREEFGEIPTLQGIQDPLAIFAGPAVASCKSLLVVDDDVQLLNYLNGSQPSFLLTANQGSGSAANGVKVQTTKANYEAVKVIQDGKAYITLEVPFTAIANSTDKSTAGGGLSPEPDQVPRKQARAFRKVVYRLSGFSADLEPTEEGEAAAAEAARKVLKSDGALDGFEDMADALVFAVVSEWSYGDVTPEVLDVMPDAAVDAIYTKAVEDDYLSKLMPNFGVSPNEDSPTGPSSA
jgi:hypothetical protein